MAGVALRGGRVRVIWRTSCWKQASEAIPGSAAAAVSITVRGAWTTHISTATQENSSTTDQACTARRRCSAARRTDSEATVHGP